MNTGSLGTSRTAATTTLLPNGKVLIVGGLGASPLASAEFYDPAAGGWAATGSLAIARYYHTATLLPNGKVLVVGGFNGTAALASAELYDPATGTWSATGSLTTGRNTHTATLLFDGRVLVCGGYGGSALASAELYDPTTGTWSATGSLAAARQNHSATLLTNGKVLVAAGTGSSTLATAELYNPATGTWSATGSLIGARYLHTAVLLPNGKVLAAGGENLGYLTSAELFDPAGNGGAGSWSATGAFTTARSRHSASLLPNGKVIIAGGFNGSGVTGAQLYDPNTGSWSATGSLVTGRYNHTVTLLTSGILLIAGGGITAELYDSAVGSWSGTGALATGRTAHTATLLPNGKVLVAGGRTTGGVAVASAELYDPAAGTWSGTAGLATARSNHTATLLSNGKVLVVGGYGGSSLGSAELFDPMTSTWSATAALASARWFHSATLLDDGRVLVVGGNNGSLMIPSYLATAEVYDLFAGTWTGAGNCLFARERHTVTKSGSANLVVGGSTSGGAPLASTGHQSLSPQVFSQFADLLTPRYTHTATRLTYGVLVAGGVGASGSLASAEQFSVGWTAVGSLATARYTHSATLLPNGKVLVAGGFGPAGAGSPPIASAELYDPSAGTWATGANLGAARSSHTATLLPNGKVLVAGGINNPAYLASAELYDPGLSFATAWQPQITAASFDAAGRLYLSGTGFRGLSSASGGNTSQDSSSGYPLVQLRRIDNEETVYLLPDQTAPFSATAFTSKPVAPFPGYALVRVIANGIPSAAAIVALPQISVEQPAGTVIADGGTHSTNTLLGTPVNIVFTIRNQGGTDLTGLAITEDGSNTADFSLTSSPIVPVPAGGSTTFTIQFPGTTTGPKSAALHIANNVQGKNPYDINLTGRAFSFAQDTDGDGLNDASEYQLAALGFDWQVSQPSLVNTLYNSANGAGLYSPAQVQALNIDVPLIQRNPSTGVFTLTIGIEKSTDLMNYNPFPMTAPQTLINGFGELEFQFTAPDNAAFFRLQAQ